jgi:hypothetical protein
MFPAELALPSSAKATLSTAMLWWITFCRPP